MQIVKMPVNSLRSALQKHKEIRDSKNKVKELRKEDSETPIILEPKMKKIIEIP
jgi:hypothetical protein